MLRVISGPGFSVRVWISRVPSEGLTHCRLGPQVVVLVWESLESVGSKTSSKLLGTGL